MMRKGRGERERHCLRSEPDGSLSLQAQTQIPSYLALDAALLDSSRGTGYHLYGGTRIGLLGDSTTGGTRRVMLSPAGVAMHVSHSACRWAMWRAPSTFVQQLGLGAECAGGPGSAYTFATGDTRTTTLAWEFVPTDQGHGYFDFSVPPSAPPDAQFLAQQASIFATAYTMPMGWINGNSPQCETCVHEASVFSQVQGLFRLVPPPAEQGQVVPAPSPLPTVHQATVLHMDLLLNSAVNPSTGEVSPRWDVVNGNDNSFGGIIDQMPHMVLYAYYHALNTGDKATVGRWMPTVDLIGSYMLGAMKVADTGVLTNTNPLAAGLANVSLADNFWDDVRFGWQDALVGSYAVQAFYALAQIHTWLGNSTAAQEYLAIYQRMVTAYNAAFWSDALGGYYDWVDSEGHPRSYFYTWHQYATIEFNITSPAQAATIMATSNRLKQHVISTYNLSSDALFSPPTNLIPLDPSDLTVDFDDEYEYGHYENGCMFHWMAGIEMQAIARANVTGNGSESAYLRLIQALTAFNSTRLWGQRWSFLGQGGPMGSDVITDGMYMLYGGLLAALNIRTTLLDGLVVMGPAAPQLEGATFTFGLLGKDITVQVVNGYARQV